MIFRGGKVIVDIRISREEMIRRVRCIGENLVKNAESIVGTENKIACIEISTIVDADDEYAQDIKINKRFYI